MNIDYKNLFKTNEFAKLCGVNKKTLIYYDNIGLFSPCFIDENGYRYYSHQQYDTFGVISAFKELDMPLKDIKEFLNNRTPDNFLSTLFSQKEILNNKIKKLKSLSSMIDNVIKITEESKGLDFNSIDIVSLDEEYLTLSDKLNNNEDSYILKAISNHIEYCANHGIGYGNPVGAMILKDKLFRHEFTKIDYLFIRTAQKIDTPPIFVKPKGLYAIAYHTGNYVTTYKTYKRLIDFIKSKDLKIIGNSYEETLLDYFSFSTPDEYITKISIQVE